MCLSGVTGPPLGRGSRCRKRVWQPGRPTARIPLLENLQGGAFGCQAPAVGVFMLCLACGPQPVTGRGSGTRALVHRQSLHPSPHQPAEAPCTLYLGLRLFLPSLLAQAAGRLKASPAGSCSLSSTGGAATGHLALTLSWWCLFPKEPSQYGVSGFPSLLSARKDPFSQRCSLMEVR